MAGSLKKYGIGREDMCVQTNTNATETFDRLGSMGGTQTLEKVPDIWDGTGFVNCGKVSVTGLTDPGDITETVAAGTLTHDVLKTKINEILAQLRLAGLI